MNVWETLFQLAILLLSIFLLAFFFSLVDEMMKGYITLMKELVEVLIDFAGWCKRSAAVNITRRTRSARKLKFLNKPSASMKKKLRIFVENSERTGT